MPVKVTRRQTEIPDITALLRESAASDKAFLDAQSQQNQFRSSAGSFNTSPLPSNLGLKDQPIGQPGQTASPINQKYNITQGFGNFNPGLYSGKTAGARHQGLDIGTPTGTQVVSPFAGIVKTGQSKDFGTYVEVRTQDGQLMRFSHLSGLSDLASKLGAVGQQIQAGQPLGFTGSTGNSTGPHLDIMYQVGGKWVDPMQFEALKRVFG